MLSQNSRYRILLKLYKKYKSSIKIVKVHSLTNCVLDFKVDELNQIMQEVEKFPLSWKFYSAQKFKFSRDFENLLIFTYR